MVARIQVTKHYDDAYMAGRSGTNFDADAFDTVITEDTDCYWTDDTGVDTIVFKFRKKVIPPELVSPAFEIYKHASKKKADPKMYGKRGGPVQYRSRKSKISGYYDRPNIRDVGFFKTQTVCRTTAFTRDNQKSWDSVLPFFERIGELYSQLAPDHYKRQINQFSKTPPGMQIGKTPFTTVTSNYNWRTALHKDKGDYTGGLGNLTVLGGDYKGGYLGFPQFRIAVDVRPRDFIVMNVHQWHANTELHADEQNVRLSFVCYFRKNMVNCNEKVDLRGETYYYKKKKLD